MGSALAPDLRRDFIRIALLQARIKELDGKRAAIALFGEFPEDANQRRNALAGNLARTVVELLSRDVGHVLKMHVVDFAVVKHIEILEFTEAGPEVIAVQHGPDVGMRELARHLERGRQRANKSRPAHELEHGRDTHRSDDFARFAEVVDAARVVVTCKFFSCSARADEAIDAQLGGQRRRCA